MEGGCLGGFFSQTKNPFSYIPMPKKHGIFDRSLVVSPHGFAPAFRPWTWQHQGEPRALPRARRSPGVTSNSRENGTALEPQKVMGGLVIQIMFIDFPDLKLGVILRFPAVKFLGVSYEHLFLAR